MFRSWRRFDFYFEARLIHNIADKGRKVISNPVHKEEQVCRHRPQPIMNESLRYVTPQLKNKIKRAHKYGSGIESEVAKNKVICPKDILEGEKGEDHRMILLAPSEETYKERSFMQ
jgi:hypothetical protein